MVKQRIKINRLYHVKINYKEMFNLKRTVLVKNNKDTGFEDCVREVVFNITNGYGTILDMSLVTDERLKEDLKERFDITIVE